MSEKKATPLDFFKPGTKYADEETQKARMDICNACSDLLRPMKVCKHCGCVMPLKTKLAEGVECPVGKW